MARFDTSGFEDVIKGMNQIGESYGEVAEEMLLESAEEVKKCWKDAAEAAGHRDTGDMIASIGFSKKVKKVDDVRSVHIYPQGKDQRGQRNAEKAFILNYGTKKIHGSRFVDVADAKSATRVEKIMRTIYERELKKRGLI